jgi:hypothetical protein
LYSKQIFVGENGTRIVIPLNYGIAPVAVPDYVWTNYLENRATPASYWRIPCANHYLQVDQPQGLAALIKVSIEPANVPDIAGEICQPIKVK